MKLELTRFCQIRLFYFQGVMYIEKVYRKINFNLPLRLRTPRPTKATQIQNHILKFSGTWLDHHDRHRMVQNHTTCNNQ